VEHDLAPDGRAFRDLEPDVRHVRVGHDDGDSREPMDRRWGGAPALRQHQGVAARWDMPEAEAAVRGDAHFLRHVAERIVLVQELDHGVLIRTEVQRGDRPLDTGQPGVRKPEIPDRALLARTDRDRRARPGRGAMLGRCIPTHRFDASRDVGLERREPLRSRGRLEPGRQASTLARPVHLHLEALRVIERSRNVRRGADQVAGWPERVESVYAAVVGPGLGLDQEPTVSGRHRNLQRAHRRVDDRMPALVDDAAGDDAETGQAQPDRAVLAGSHRESSAGIPIVRLALLDRHEAVFGRAYPVAAGRELAEGEGAVVIGLHAEAAVPQRRSVERDGRIGNWRVGRIHHRYSDVRRCDGLGLLARRRARRGTRGAVERAAWSSPLGRGHPRCRVRHEHPVAIHDGRRSSGPRVDMAGGRGSGPRLCAVP
jgi:hypothetical protein